MWNYVAFNCSECMYHNKREGELKISSKKLIIILWNFVSLSEIWSFNFHSGKLFIILRYLQITMLILLLLVYQNVREWNTVGIVLCFIHFLPYIWKINSFHEILKEESVDKIMLNLCKNWTKYFCFFSVLENTKTYISSFNDDVYLEHSILGP